MVSLVTRIVTNENQRNTELTKTDKSWINYRALTKTGLSDNIVGKCSLATNKSIFDESVYKKHMFRAMTIFTDVK